MNNYFMLEKIFSSDFVRPAEVKVRRAKQYEIVGAPCVWLLLNNVSPQSADKYSTLNRFSVGTAL